MSRLFSPAFNQQFFDENGKPLAAGKLYTYVAGSSTPVATYKAITGGAMNTNPIILDSAGYADFVLEVGASYKFVLKDKNDAFKKQWDNVTAADVSSIIEGLITDIEGKADRANPSTNGNLAELDAFGNVKDSYHKATDFALAEDVDGKMDKVSGANNNIPLFSNDGNLKDSGKSFIDFVRTDEQQQTNDKRKKQGRDNISAQKYVGGPGSFIDASVEAQDDFWASVGVLDLKQLGIFQQYYNCFINISLSLEVTVYNTGSADSEIVEHGRFNINVHAEPSNNKWIVDAGWAEYKGRGNARLVELMRVSRNNNASGIGKLTLDVKVPQPSVFYANALNVSVLNNYGSIHKNDNLNYTMAFVAPWTLYLGGVWENLLGEHENISPINYYSASHYDSYVDYSTFSGSCVEVRPQYQSDAKSNATLNRGNIPVIKEDGRFALPIDDSNNNHKFFSIRENGGYNVFKAGDSLSNSQILSSVYPYRGKMQTSEISGTTLVASLYDYPMVGQIHSIGLWIAIPASNKVMVAATWHYNDPSTPVKNFYARVETTYYDNGELKKVVLADSNPYQLSASQTGIALISVALADIDKISVDFIDYESSTKKMYHVDYIPKFNVARIYEDSEQLS